MEFIQDLSEARLIGRSKTGLRRFSAKDIADLLFLHICALQLLKHEFLGLPEAQKYISGAGPLTNFDQFVSSRNELYLLVHVLVGRNAKAQQALLTDQEASQLFLDRIRINLPYLRRYLKMILAGKIDEGYERRFLLMMEKDLKITDNYYRAIRRLVSSWSKQSRSSRKLVMTRLLQIMRGKARRSEMMGIIEWMSKQEHLEDKRLDPLEGEGPGQKIEAPAKKTTGFLKKLAVGTAAAGIGAYAGYKMARRGKK